MNKTKTVAVVAILIAIASAGLFMGTTNKFKKRVDYLSEKYPFFECQIPWKDYPAWRNNMLQEFTLIDYGGVGEAASWTAFKSMLLSEEIAPNSLFYDPNARVIWFDKIEYEYNYYGAAVRARYVTVFIRC